jgi:RNA polymerase sigma-70 factor (ECF subfamily)
MSDRRRENEPVERAEFPATSWGLIAGIQASGTSVRKTALESLCRRYWAPVYHYVRRAWAKSPEDAQDLTQAFFLRILEGDVLRHYRPERGGFRTYLKVMLRGFAADQHDAVAALKRGGGVKVIPIDGTAAPLKELLADPRAEDPERVFDWAWKKEVLERAVERTRAWFTSSGREIQFRAFEQYDAEVGADRPTYADVARRLGVGESDVRNYLFAVRERLRTEIRAELAQTVASPSELDEEWNSLFGP